MAIIATALRAHCQRNAEEVLQKLAWNTFPDNKGNEIAAGSSPICKTHVHRTLIGLKHLTRCQTSSASSSYHQRIRGTQVLACIM